MIVAVMKAEPWAGDHAEGRSRAGIQGGLEEVFSGSSGCEVRGGSGSPELLARLGA